MAEYRQMEPCAVGFAAIAAGRLGAAGSGLYPNAGRAMDGLVRWPNRSDGPAEEPYLPTV
jgi:hypothetical protein